MLDQFFEAPDASSPDASKGAALRLLVPHERNRCLVFLIVLWKCELSDDSWSQTIVWELYHAAPPGIGELHQGTSTHHQHQLHVAIADNIGYQWEVVQASSMHDASVCAMREQLQPKHTGTDLMIDPCENMHFQFGSSSASAVCSSTSARSTL